MSVTTTATQQPPAERTCPMQQGSRFFCCPACGKNVATFFSDRHYASECSSSAPSAPTTSATIPLRSEGALADTNANENVRGLILPDEQAALGVTPKLPRLYAVYHGGGDAHLWLTISSIPAASSMAHRLGCGPAQRVLFQISVWDELLPHLCKGHSCHCMVELLAAEHHQRRCEPAVGCKRLLFSSACRSTGLDVESHGEAMLWDVRDLFGQPFRISLRLFRFAAWEYATTDRCTAGHFCEPVIRSHSFRVQLLGLKMSASELRRQSG